GVGEPLTTARSATRDRITTPFGAETTAAEVVDGINLGGKRAIVTGGASGIGIETARARRWGGRLGDDGGAQDRRGRERRAPRSSSTTSTTRSVTTTRSAPTGNPRRRTSSSLSRRPGAGRTTGSPQTP